MKIDLTGRVALVTGGTGELGRVMVRTLASCGADVAIHYHRAADRAASLAREVTGMGRRTVTVQADVTKKDEVERMREAVVTGLGAPDIIVNNAVIQYTWVSVLDQAEADYRSQFESCTLHNVAMAQVFVPAMIRRKWGRVIGINTECSLQCYPGQSAYAAAKRGMDGVLRVLAREVGEHGITVNQVAPGWMVSETRPVEGRPDSYRDRIPLKRYGNDQDIANAVAFLASDLAGYITGVFLPVCGGNNMVGI